MADSSRPAFSVVGLFADRDAKREQEREAMAKLERQRDEELAAWKKRLDEFVVTDAHRQLIMERIKAAFDRGENEYMLAAFPSSLCTDGGRAIANAYVPPLNPPTPEDLAREEREGPAWLDTMPKGARPVYEFWRKELKPGGFRFNVRIINFPDGKPGDVGVFFAWPRNALEAAGA